jgi:Caspase domain
MTGARRYLIAAGTATYKHLGSLPSVTDDITRVVDCFTGLGYTRVLPELGEDPDVDDLRRCLGDWLSGEERRPSDLLILYYSGHGERVENDTHYLAARNTRYSGPMILPHTAFPDEELASSLRVSPIQHALIILDTCFAGEGITAFSGRALKALSDRRWTDEWPRGIYLIAAAQRRQQAQEGVFSKALCAAIRTTGGRIPPFLAPGDVVARVNTILRDVPQKAEWMLATPLKDAVVTLIPNPLWEPGRPEGLEVDTAWRAGAGASDSVADRRYFTGRAQALRELVRWLEGEPDRRARVVTGGPGVGKSALLGWLVALSRADERAALDAAGALADIPIDTRPPVGAVDVAIDAHGKAIGDIVAAIAAGLGAAAATAAELVDAAKARERVVTIVVDGLDEAVDSARLARELLRRLALLPTVRLLVGTRPDGISRPHEPRVKSLPGAEEIDLDDERYLDAEDVVRYVRRRLLAVHDGGADSPYRERADLVDPLAAEVARRAGGNFLVARIVTSMLLKEPTATDVAAARIPASVAEAFDVLLDGFGGRLYGGLLRTTVTDLLRPLAYARGAGLPRVGLWAPLAGALAAEAAEGDDAWRVRYTDGDLDELFAHAGAYVVESVEDGGSRYRLFHEALGERLRAEAEALSVERRITRTLVDLSRPRAGDRPDWVSAPAYVRSHLASHAAASGLLDDLVRDPWFLACAEPMALLRALQRGRDEESTALARRAYQMAWHHLVGKDITERLAYLEMVAHQQECEAFVGDTIPSGTRMPWRTRWANWWPVTTHRLLLQADGPVNGLAFLRHGDRGIVVASGRRFVSVVDIADGSPIHEPILVAETSDPSRASPDQLAILPTIDALSVETVIGEQIIAAASGHGLIQTWRLADASPRWNPLQLLLSEVQGLFLTELSDRAVIVVGGRSLLDNTGVIGVFDLESGNALWESELQEAHPGQVCLALCHGDDKRILISGGDDGKLRVWALDDGQLLHEVDHAMLGGRSIGPMAATSLAGRSIVLVGVDESIQVWCLGEQGLQLDHEPRAGHSSGVTAVALVPEGRPPAYASVGKDLKLTQWRLDDSTPFAQHDTPEDFIGRITLGSVGGSSVWLTGDDGGAVRVWPAGSVRSVSAKRYAGQIERLDRLRVDDETIVCTLSRAERLELWRAREGVAYESPLIDGGRVHGCAVGKVGGEPAIAMRTHLHPGEYRVYLARPPWTSLATVPSFGGDDVLLVSDEAGDYLVEYDDASGRLTARAVPGGAIAWKVDGQPDPALRRVMAATSAPGTLILEVPRLLPGAVRMRALATGRPLAALLGGPEPNITAVAAGQIAGRHVAVLARTGGVIEIWSLDTLDRVDGPSNAPGSRVAALAVTERAGRLWLAGTGSGHLFVSDDRRLVLDVEVDVQHIVPIDDGGLVVAGSEGMMRLDVT